MPVTPYDCPTCGQTHPRGCHAHKSSDGTPCRNPPIPGLTVCRYHGGAPRHVKKAAARRVTEEAINRAALELIRDAPPMTSITEVYDELLAVAGTARAMRQVMENRVADLTTTGYEGETGEQVRADVILLERALDRSAKVMEQIARLNIDERKQVIAENQGRLVADAIRTVLEQLNVPIDDRAREVIVTTLRRIVKEPK